MKKIYVYDKISERMVEKKPENEVCFPEIKYSDSAFFAWLDKIEKELLWKVKHE